MRWVVGLVVVVLVALASPATASTQRVRLTDAEVAAALARHNWSPAAIRWVQASIPVYADPLLPWEENLAGGFYTPTHDRVAHVVVAWRTSDAVIEHEVHHAWDWAHPEATERRWFAMQRLVREGGRAGEVARAILADETVDQTHYTHALIERLNGDARDVPAWFRTTYLGYLAAPAPVRVLVPLAVRPPTPPRGG